MTDPDRRQFLALAGSALTGIAAQMSSRPKTVLRKALKFSMVQEPALSIAEKFQLLVELGFEGVELPSPGPLDRKEVLAARDRTGLQIPGVLDAVSWKKPLSHPDPAIRAEGIAGLETALGDARAYGASTVLLIPAVVTREVSYDAAYHRSQAEIRKVLPLAERMGVRIAVENVWNRFLYSPLEMARYLDEFESPWIGAYFDVGNVVNYGWPEQWIRILGSRILKFDIKEFSRQKYIESGFGAALPALGEGDCDWAAIRRAIADIGYRGWGSAEVAGGNRERLREISERMDRILAAG